MVATVHTAILHCWAPDDVDIDDLVLKMEPRYEFWSGGIHEGSEWDTNTFVPWPIDSATGKPTKHAWLTLIDRDWPNDDVIGTHTLDISELGQGWHRADFQNGEAHYHLDYEVYDS